MEAESALLAHPLVSLVKESLAPLFPPHLLRTEPVPLRVVVYLLLAHLPAVADEEDDEEELLLLSLGTIRTRSMEQIPEVELELSVGREAPTTTQTILVPLLVQQPRSFIVALAPNT